jgi:hypothetical protein
MLYYRHWHALSEKYTGADSLLTALENGWVIKPAIQQEPYWRNSRLVTLFHIHLERAGELAEMVVVGNPYLSGFIARFQPVVAHA